MGRPILIFRDRACPFTPEDVELLRDNLSAGQEWLAEKLNRSFMHYNFCRVHKTLGTTPAVAAGIADHVWKVAEIIALLDQAERAVPQKRGKYKKRQAA